MIGPLGLRQPIRDLRIYMSTGILRTTYNEDGGGYLLRHCAYMNWRNDHAM